jgi:phosphatidylglycerophosphatase A
MAAELDDMQLPIPAMWKKRLEKGIKPRPRWKKKPPLSNKRFWGAWRFVTFFGVGKSAIAPGTMGSVAGVLVILAAAFAGQMCFGPTGAAVFLFGMLFFLFFMGIYTSHICVEAIGIDDPGEIVIDEVVGMYLTILLSIAFLWVPEMRQLGEVRMLYADHMGVLIVLMFFAFRAMDIFKPWPIGWIDAKVEGGLGVMLDDALAGIYAAVITVLGYALLLGTVWKPQ